MARPMESLTAAASVHETRWKYKLDKDLTVSPVSLVSDGEQRDSVERVLHHTRQVQCFGSQLHAARAVLPMSDR